jgi:LysR family transcriptional regulator for metE and metH
MILEVRHLRVADAVQRAGTMSGAAQALHLTQPAVSHAVRDLEARLGVELFQRRRRRMVATPAGERLLAGAHRVLDELARTEDDLAGYRTGQRGTARITTECYTCYHWLPAILRRFLDEYPDAQVQIVPEAVRAPVQALLDGALDLAILHHRPNHRDLAVTPLFEDEIVAVVPPGHRLAERPFLGAAEFEPEHVILHSDPEDSSLFELLLRPAGVTPRRVSKLPLTEALLEAVKAGLGVSVMARWAVRPEVDAGNLVAIPLGSGGLRRAWYAATLRRQASSPLLSALVAQLTADALGATEACADPCGAGKPTEVGATSSRT